MVSFDYGIYDWSDGKGNRFNWSHVRQFSLSRDGEYDHMEHLRCDLLFEPTSTLEAVGGGGSLTANMYVEWFDEVEQPGGFLAVVDLMPFESRFGQHDV